MGCALAGTCSVHEGRQRDRSFPGVGDSPSPVATRRLGSLHAARFSARAIAVLSLAGCGAVGDTGGVQARFFNSTNWHITNFEFSPPELSVSRLAAGEASDYQPADGAYSNGGFDFDADGVPRTSAPHDFVGEPKLTPGHYTFVIETTKLVAEGFEVNAERDP